jgi:hypothetical protein
MMGPKAAIIDGIQFWFIRFYWFETGSGSAPTHLKEALTARDTRDAKENLKNKPLRKNGIGTGSASRKLL